MKKGTIITTKGDVTKPVPFGECPSIIIPHCCNDIGVMGAGVARALRNKWPLVYTEYRQDFALGSTTFVKVLEILDSHSSYSITVANMVAQTGVGGARPLRYEFLIKCMREVAAMALKIAEGDTVPEIHAPKFGSALAGGNWDFILDLIDELWLQSGINVKIYEF